MVKDPQPHGQGPFERVAFGPESRRTEQLALARPKPIKASGFADLKFATWDSGIIMILGCPFSDLPEVFHLKVTYGKPTNSIENNKDLEEPDDSLGTAKGWG